MKSHGSGDDERMIKLAFITSKFSVMVTAFFAVPLIIEMPYILKVWLTSPPEYTVELCQWILVLTLVTQCSLGLMNSISASGRIMKYQIVMSIMILSNVPISYIVLKVGLPPYYCTIGFVVIELFSLVARLTMAHKIVGIDINKFVVKVIKPTSFCVLLSIIPCYFCHVIMSSSLLRTIVVFMVFILLHALSSWCFTLTLDEKAVFISLYNKSVNRIKKKYEKYS
jgi:hypothetical protein